VNRSCSVARVPPAVVKRRRAIAVWLLSGQKKSTWLLPVLRQRGAGLGCGTARSTAVGCSTPDSTQDCARQHAACCRAQHISCGRHRLHVPAPSAPSAPLAPYVCSESVRCCCFLAQPVCVCVCVCLCLCLSFSWQRASGACVRLLALHCGRLPLEPPRKPCACAHSHGLVACWQADAAARALGVAW
jgi:hypothetical protein